MPGSTSITGDEAILYADNVSFDGTKRGGKMTTDGQLWIGSTASNRANNGGHVRLGTITSPLGTLSIGYSAPNITMDLIGGATAIEKIALQSGTTPIVPSAGQITFNGATVAAGTHPVQTNGTGANTMALQVQISQAIASTDATKIGLAAFNSAQFIVDANGFVSSTGSFLTITTVNHAASPYTVLTTDEFLAVDTSGGVVTLKLPNAPTTARVIYIKDSKGTSASSNISVTTVGGTVTIDGQTTYTIATNYEAINVIFDGANYEVF